MPKTIPPTGMIGEQKNRMVVAQLYISDNFYLRKMTINHYPRELFEYRMYDEVMFCFYNHIIELRI